VELRGIKDLYIDILASGIGILQSFLLSIQRIRDEEIYHLGFDIKKDKNRLITEIPVKSKPIRTL
jgi:hypothetical protein